MLGGSFGIKVHIYADEMATYALSKLLRRPVKFVADRVESFNTDIHARDHRCRGRIGVRPDGNITAFEIDDLTGIGPYFDVSAHQRYRGQPGGQSGWRALCHPELSGAGAGCLPEQERDVSVPRRSAIRLPVPSPRVWSTLPRRGSARTLSRSAGAT